MYRYTDPHREVHVVGIGGTLRESSTSRWALERARRRGSYDDPHRPQPARPTGLPAGDVGCRLWLGAAGLSRQGPRRRRTPDFDGGLPWHAGRSDEECPRLHGAPLSRREAVPVGQACRPYCDCRRRDRGGQLDQRHGQCGARTSGHGGPAGRTDSQGADRVRQGWQPDGSERCGQARPAGSRGSRAGHTGLDGPTCGSRQLATIRARTRGASCAWERPFCCYNSVPGGPL